MGPVGRTWRQQAEAIARINEAKSTQFVQTAGSKPRLVKDRIEPTAEPATEEKPADETAGWRGWRWRAPAEETKAAEATAEAAPEEQPSAEAASLPTKKSWKRAAVWMT